MEWPAILSNLLSLSRNMFCQRLKKVCTVEWIDFSFSFIYCDFVVCLIICFPCHTLEFICFSFKKKKTFFIIFFKIDFKRYLFKIF